MKHSCLTSIFSLCLAFTVAVAPVHASEISQQQVIAEETAAEIIETSGEEDEKTGGTEGREESCAEEESADSNVSSEEASQAEEPKDTSEAEAVEEAPQTEEADEAPESKEEEKTPEAEAVEEAPQTEETEETAEAEAVEETAEAEVAEENPATEEASQEEEVTEENRQADTSEVVSQLETADEESAIAAELQEGETAALTADSTATAEVQEGEDAALTADTATAEGQESEAAALTADTATAEGQESESAALTADSATAEEVQTAALMAVAASAATAAQETKQAEAAAAVPAENLSAPAALMKAAAQTVTQMKLEVIDYHNNGYGDSQMLSSGGKNLLIDTYTHDAWNTLNDWLWDHNYKNFDIYISHYHDDHMDNVKRILYDGKYKVSKLYLPDFSYMTGSSEYMERYIEWTKGMISTAKDYGVQVIYLKKGSSFSFGDVTANVLWGTDYEDSTHKVEYINNNSLLTRFTCGNTRYLNGGDLEVAGEEQILKAKVDVKADILKMNHHGGNNGNSAAFLKAVNPTFIYYNSCADSASNYNVSGSWTRSTVQNAEKYGNVSSVRYNGDITYNVRNDIILQKMERNYTTQKVYLYESKNSKNLKGIVTQQFNKASKKHFDDRSYGAYSCSTTKKAGTYASDGWILGNSGSQEYYFRNNKIVTGWLKTGGKMYFMDADGTKHTGWLKRGNKMFFMNADGSMHTGWLKRSSNMYYMNADGTMHKGWLKTGGKMYFINANGTMHKGWLKRGNKMFYMNADGSMHTGWLKRGSNTYYMNADGSMHKGWLKVGSKMYFMNADGTLHTGWLKRGNKMYFMNADGSMHKGWLRRGSKLFYLNADGTLKTA